MNPKGDGKRAIQLRYILEYIQQMQLTIERLLLINIHIVKRDMVGTINVIHLPPPYDLNPTPTATMCNSLPIYVMQKN